jgi:hypothetical protein
MNIPFPLLGIVAFSPVVPQWWGANKYTYKCGGPQNQTEGSQSHPGLDPQ